jgi:hypothetical protein
MDTAYKDSTMGMGTAERLEFARSKGMRTVRILSLPSTSRSTLDKKIQAGVDMAKTNKNILVFSSDPRAYVQHAAASGRDVSQELQEPFLCFFQDACFCCLGPDDQAGSFDRDFCAWLMQQMAGCHQ